MKKIISVVLSVILLISVVLAVPFLVNAETYETTNVDFNESCYDPSKVDARLQRNAAIVDLSATDSTHGKVMNLTRVGGKSGNPKKQNAKVGICNAEGTDYFLAKADVLYLISFEYSTPTVSTTTGKCYLTPFGSTVIGDSNYSFDGSIELFTLSQSSDWKTYTGTFKFDTDTWIGLECFDITNGATSGNLANKYKNQKIYIDNIKIDVATKVSYGGGIDAEAMEIPTTVRYGDTYENALKPLNVSGFKGWYLDAEYTTPATGSINALSVTLYAKIDEAPYYYYNVVDFTEAGYDNNANVPGIDGGIYPVERTADSAAVGGVAMKFSLLRKSGSKNYAKCVRAVDTDGTTVLQLKRNVKYRITYDVKYVSGPENFVVGLYLPTHGNVAPNTAPKATHTYNSANLSNGYDTCTSAFEITAPSNADARVLLGVYSAGSTDNVSAEIYIDNVTIKTISTRNLVIKNYNGTDERLIAVDGDTTWNSIIPASPVGLNFGGFFLDEQFTTSVTGATVGDVETVYIKWDVSKTTVTFDEPFYVDAVNGVYIEGLQSFDRAQLADDAQNGKVMLYERISGKNLTDASGRQWPNVTRLASNLGNNAFRVDQGEKYKVTYDIKKVKADVAFSVYLAVTDGSLSDVRDGVEILIGDEAAETDGNWTTSKTVYYTAPASGTPVLLIRQSGTSRKDEQEIYFDNVKIEYCTGTTTITLENNGGEGVTFFKNFAGRPLSSFAAPTKAGYIFAGWYTDAALTIPYKVENVPAQGLTLYAKWIEEATTPYSFKLGFENEDYDYGAIDDITNAKSDEVAVYKDSVEAYEGEGRLCINDTKGTHPQTADRMLSFALMNKDGTPFQVVKGTRYRLSFKVNFTGNTENHAYLTFNYNDSVPISGINEVNSTLLLNIGSGGVFSVNDNWYSVEEYFVAEKTSKVFVCVYNESLEKIMEFDDIKVEVIDASQATLLEYYDTDNKLIYSTLGEIGSEIGTDVKRRYVPQQKMDGKEFTGWHIGSAEGELFTASTYPDTDLKLYASYKDADVIPETPTTDFSKPVVVDFEDAAANYAFYNSSESGHGGNSGLHYVSDNPDDAHTGNGYFRYHQASHWMKEYYRTLHFFHDASVGNKIWLEPSSAYKVTYYYNPDEVGASNLYLVGFSDNYEDGYEILAENYLANANIFAQFGKWNKYETIVFTGANTVNLGFVLYGGYFSVSIDDITVTKLEHVTITFETNGGTKVNDVTQLSEGFLMPPAEPEKDGFKFIGWYTDAKLTKAFDFANTLVTKDITLYAKWESKYETVVTYVDKEVEVYVTPEDAHLDEKTTIIDDDSIGQVSSGIPTKQNSGFPWLFVIITAGVVVLGAAVFIIIMFAKKKRKEQK